MRRVLATVLAALAAWGCVPTLESAPVEPAPVSQVEELDPAETGMCHGRYVRVEVPEVPAGTADPDAYLQSYYDTFMRAYCDAETAARTLDV